MQQVLSFLSLLKRDCPEMKYTMITGTLTDKDRKLGNWAKSIPFYRKLVHRCPDEFQYGQRYLRFSAAQGENKKNPHHGIG